jgi:hypothetical protein
MVVLLPELARVFFEHAKDSPIRRLQAVGASKRNEKEFDRAFLSGCPDNLHSVSRVCVKRSD